MSARGRPYWQDASSYAYLKNADRTGLMWEWLRRDPGYLSWYATASAVTGGPRCDVLNWGLHFRRRTGPGLPLGPDSLACNARSIDPSGGSRAGGSRRSLLSRCRQDPALAYCRPGRFGHGACCPVRRKSSHQARCGVRLSQPAFRCPAALLLRRVGKGRGRRSAFAAPAGTSPPWQVRKDALPSRCPC